MAETTTTTTEATTDAPATETSTPEENTQAAIDMEKYDKAKEAAKPAEITKPTEDYERELAAEKVKYDKLKESFDKTSKEIADMKKAAKEAKAAAEAPLTELEEARQELARIKQEQTKADLTYSLSENLAVSKEFTGKIVSSIFSEATGGLVIGDFETAIRELVDNIREASKKEGYEQRHNEIMNGKPRSIGGQQKLDVFEEKRLEYLTKKGRTG
jgi:flagellar biosynthesis GTPase FlhF